MSELTVNEVKISLQKFGWPDYLVFLLMLVSCSMIGIYFGFYSKKSKSAAKKADEYLVGGRNMNVLPIAMSLVASYISGITLLGTPTEIYVYGIQYIYIIGAIVLTGFAMMYVYLPVFHGLQLTSTYEYLQTRFDKKTRLFGSVLFTLGTMTWLPIVVYLPALAFNQVTGINIHLVSPVVCIVCIFYTCVGGLKAVVWTDVIQTISMFGAMVLVIVKGTMDVGGPQFVWESAVASGRIEGPDMRFDVFVRHSVWALVIGGFPLWLKTNAVSQIMIQRYFSLPTLKDANRALWLFLFGVTVLTLICSYSGLLIYAVYQGCDPLSTKLVQASDQLLPLYVMETLGEFPGLPGLFVAGVFAAALSSMSTGLNAMSAVVLEDFFKPYSKKTLTEQQSGIIIRLTAAIVGASSVGLVFLIEKTGSTILQLANSLASVQNGSMLGIFTVGLLFPWVNNTGALSGGVAGLVTMIWLVYGAQVEISKGNVVFDKKPVSTDECTYTFERSTFTTNETIAITAQTETSIYQISYMWYTLIGTLITMIVAAIVTLITGPNKVADMDPKLFAPFIQRLVFKNVKQSEDPSNSELGLRSYDSTSDVSELKSNDSMNKKYKQIIMKSVVAIFGTICVALVTVVERLGTVLQLSMSLSSITNGPLLGIFTMGILMPWVQGTGALVGGTTGLVTMAWLCFKAQAEIAMGKLKFEYKPLSTQECPYVFMSSPPMSMLAENVTSTAVPDEIFEKSIYHISYMWYVTIGASITMVVALVASFITGPNKPENMNPKLFAPFVQRMIIAKVEKLKAKPTELGMMMNNDDGVKCISIINIDTSDKRCSWDANKNIEKYVDTHFLRCLGC